MLQASTLLHEGKQLTAVTTCGDTREKRRNQERSGRWTCGERSSSLNLLAKVGVQLPEVCEEVLREQLAV